MATTTSARPTAWCPSHGTPLEGGPILFRCPEGHRVQAADIDREYQPRRAEQ
ncbi:hypothetical protein [Thermomonospora umbrina]|uniref:Uncharacterized protein n=1 Tax=Thermomonospora umbrina TaxID=111806 RepID=A0A3D9T0M3_9ACTN|nr:hypothetical protein [Thermomonospora umbrina]REF00351.1 hypothetical protein DFJ69_5883 [Thermomonospora umbrina]